MMTPTLRFVPMAVMSSEGMPAKPTLALWRTMSSKNAARLDGVSSAAPLTAPT